MAYISVTNTFVNSTTASATDVNTNFTDIINGTSDGTKDFSIAALTCAGTLTANGNVTLGNATTDDITVTGSLAATLNIKTTTSYDIGSTSIGLRAIYLGDAGSAARCTKLLGATIGSGWTFTFPTGAGTSRYRLETDGAGATSWVKSFTSADDIRNASLAVSLSGNAMTVALKGADGNDPSTTNPVTIVFRNATATTGSLTEVVVTSALSVTVSSGSTLGTVSGVESKINVYAINNAGTVELAVANLGATSTDGRISTTAEGGGGAADSATVFYSTTARSNVAFRLLGAVVSTQATAGTWATAITSIITVGCGLTFAPVMTEWTSYTPTIGSGWASNNTPAGKYRRVGDSVELDINIAVTGAQSGNLSTVSLPSGLTIDTSKLSQTATEQGIYGTGYSLAAGATQAPIFVAYRNTTTIRPLISDNSATYGNVTGINATAPATWANGDNIQFTAKFPIVGWFARDWQVNS